MFNVDSGQYGVDTDYICVLKRACRFQTTATAAATAATTTTTTATTAAASTSTTTTTAATTTTTTTTSKKTSSAMECTKTSLQNSFCGRARSSETKAQEYAGCGIEVVAQLDGTLAHFSHCARAPFLLRGGSQSSS